jgi:hypothetical protein
MQPTEKSENDPSSSREKVRRRGRRERRAPTRERCLEGSRTPALKFDVDCTPCQILERRLRERFPVWRSSARGRCERSAGETIRRKKPFPRAFTISPTNNSARIGGSRDAWENRSRVLQHRARVTYTVRTGHAYARHDRGLGTGARRRPDF